MANQDVSAPVVIIEHAKAGDARAIKALIDRFAGRELLLPRTLTHVLATIRDFIVARVNGEFAGCVALHVDLEDLAELRSLAVDERFRGLGVGRKLVEAALADAAALGVPRVYALTYVVDFFRRFGFEVVPHTDLPNKVWADCVNCNLFPDCNETAMVCDLASQTRSTP